MQTFSFGGTQWINDFREQVFILFYLLVSDALRHHRQLRSEDNRSQRQQRPWSRYHYQHSHSVGGTTAVSSFLFLPNVDFHTGQQQVPLSVSHPHNLSLSSAAGSTFFSWSGIVDSLLLWCRPLWFVLVSLPAALHLALIKPSVLSNLTFFRPLHHIAFHPAAREKKRDYLFFWRTLSFFGFITSY